MSEVIEAQGTVMETGEEPNGTGRHRKRAPKPTKVEQESRITEVYKLLIIGLARHDILRYIAEKTTWGLAERTVDFLIGKATARFQEHAKTVRDQEIGKAIARMNDLYSRTHRIQDYKTALAAQKELSELLGLYAPKRMELTGPEGGPQQFIAFIPQGPQDREAWSQQAKAELASRQQHQRAIGSTPSGGA